MNPNGSQNATPLTLEQLQNYLEPRLQAIETRFHRLETKMDQGFAEVHARLREHDGHFDFLFKKFEDLEQEYLFVNVQMKRLDQSDTQLRQEIDVLKAQRL